jgi:hypothetical protein
MTGDGARESDAVLGEVQALLILNKPRGDEINREICKNLQCEYRSRRSIACFSMHREVQT